MGNDHRPPGLPGAPVRPLVTRGEIWSIAAATGVFLAVAVALLLIVSHVVLSMRATANQIDDERALTAVAAAAAALERRLSLTVRDNALWDEAFEALSSDGAGDWIRENWGEPSADYPLYDGVAVLDANGGVIAAYLKGVPVDLAASAPEIVALTERPDEGEVPPKSGLTRIGEAVAVFGAMPVQPFSPRPGQAGGPMLVLVKLLDDETVATIARDYQITDLALGPKPSGQRLNLALRDLSGTVIGHLIWPSRAPGDQAFERLRPMLIFAAAILFLFLAMVLAAGFLESHRLRRIAASAEAEAKRDPLSGMLNRAGLLDALRSLSPQASPARPLTLHLLDLDGFKQVNDTWGHAVGDLLIAAVAVRLAGFKDQFVAIGRLGGDEFAMAQLQAEQPGIMAQRVVQAFSRPFTVGDRQIEVQASVGHASTFEPLDPAELIRRADVAMYGAKQAGKYRALAYRVEMESRVGRVSS